MARIFVVEDESIVALNLQNRLKNLGYDAGYVDELTRELIIKL